jgi:hypothetical protein
MITLSPFPRKLKEESKKSITIPTFGPVSGPILARETIISYACPGVTGTN